MNGITLLDDTRLKLLDKPIDIEPERKAAVDAFWRETVKTNPRLWNGPFFMFRNVSVKDGVLRGTAYRTDFSTFFHWRQNGRDPAVVHITGTSLPILSDGSLLAVRMAEHTANAGQLYFPAGSLDRLDLDDGLFDITTNIRRELAEETGLEPLLADFEKAFAAVFDEGAWHITRRCRIPMDFAQVCEHVRNHQAKTGDDELSGLVAIRTPAEADKLKPYAKALALWHFGAPNF